MDTLVEFGDLFQVSGGVDLDVTRIQMAMEEAKKGNGISEWLTDPVNFNSVTKP